MRPGPAEASRFRGAHLKLRLIMINNLEDLYYDQIRDLYSAETQLLEALPDLCEAASNDELRQALGSHLAETREQRERLAKICARHGIAPEGTTCEAMRGLVKEAANHASAVLAGDVRDAAIIASSNRVEHYEIAGYGAAKAFAQVLGFGEDVDLLDTSIEEEGAADKTLTKIATGGLFSGGVNQAAV
jgi:ferritin-like metal-binding protein YciE